VTPAPIQDRIPTREIATERRLSPPLQEKTPVLEPRVDKGKQPERRPDPSRAPPPSAPVESSTRTVIRIPKDGQTITGFFRILKELKGDIGDI
jgi:hypothetical protein